MDITSYLRQETTAATGCTEPAAVGLGAAAAASVLPGERIDAIEVLADPNLYKNGMGVFIPGSEGGCGLELAAAMGAAVREPSRGLEVFGGMDADKLASARALIRRKRVSAGIHHGSPGLYVRVRITGQEGHMAESLIQGKHDNITALSLDGEAVPMGPAGGGPDGKTAAGADSTDWLKALSLEDMLALAGEVDGEDAEYIRHGLDLNLALAAYGREHRSGLGVGRALEELAAEGVLLADVAGEAASLVCAAVDARMGGVQLPAMTLCGSGNQGISAGLPLVALARRKGLQDDLRMIRAVALSSLAVGVIKAHTGRLSALCGSALASGTGVAMASAWLLGGGLEQVGGAAMNFIEETAGVVCDGAKTSCALKLSASVNSAVKSAYLALKGVVVSSADGIVGRDAGDTMKNLGLLGKGMVQADSAILKIMLAKRV